MDIPSVIAPLLLDNLFAGATPTGPLSVAFAALSNLRIVMRLLHVPVVVESALQL